MAVPSASRIAHAERTLTRHQTPAGVTGRVRGDTGPLLIYTDGSVSGRPIAGGLGVMSGWGYLATDGYYGCGRMPQFDKAGGDPAAVTELRAIWQALNGRTITALAVVTDSRRAASILAGWKTGSTRMPTGYTGSRNPRKVPTLEQLRRLVVEHADRIVVEWVKGHAGNILNEGADTLAQLGMRWGRDGLDRDDVTRRADGIAQGFLDQWRTE